MTENVVLEETYDPDYEPNTDEIAEYSAFLGMDLKEDKVLYGARISGYSTGFIDAVQNNLYFLTLGAHLDSERGTQSSPPTRLEALPNGEGRRVLFQLPHGRGLSFENTKHHLSEWNHPCDKYYRRLYKEEKKKANYKRRSMEETVRRKRMRRNTPESFFSNNYGKSKPPKESTAPRMRAPRLEVKVIRNIPAARTHAYNQAYRKNQRSSSHEKRIKRQNDVKLETRRSVDSLKLKYDKAINALKKRQAKDMVLNIQLPLPKPPTDVSHLPDQVNPPSGPWLTLLNSYQPPTGNSTEQKSCLIPHGIPEEGWRGCPAEEARTALEVA
eukprot:670449-Amorphochlora_amoeboformis.AAC.1